jgi:hypothetical protein
VVPRFNEHFSVEPGGPERLAISWDQHILGNAYNVVVYLDGKMIAGPLEEAQLLSGCYVNLPNGSHLRLKTTGPCLVVLPGRGLEVRLDGGILWSPFTRKGDGKVPKIVSNPKLQYRLAFALLGFLVLANTVGGVLRLASNEPDGLFLLLFAILLFCTILLAWTGLPESFQMGASFIVLDLLCSLLVGIHTGEMGFFGTVAIKFALAGAIWRGYEALDYLQYLESLPQPRSIR